MEKDEIKRTLQQLEPIIGNQAKKLWKLYIIAENPKEKAERAKIVRLLADKHLNNFDPKQVNLIPPEKKESGNYNVGTILYGADYKPSGDFCLNDDDWMRHIGIFGSTGSGKTTVVYNLLKHLTDNDKPFLMLDWKKDYRDLLKLPEFKDKLLVFTVGKKASPFHFNPLQRPPGVDEHVWKKQLMEIINHAYLLGPGAESIIREHIDDGTFAEMLDNLSKQKKRGREQLWQSSAKRTLESINYPGIYEVVNADSYDIPDLLNKKVILELDGLSTSDKVFLIGCLLQWIYHYRMQQPDREIWKHTIFLEEAHHLLLQQPKSKPENYADALMREVRVLGQSIVVIDQQPSKLSDSAMANVNTKVCLHLNHSTDITAMQKALILDNFQKDYIGMLSVGYAIIKNHRITLPFLAGLPDFSIGKGLVTDDDVSELMKPFLENSQSINPQKQESGSFSGVQKRETPLSVSGLLTPSSQNREGMAICFSKERRRFHARRLRFIRFPAKAKILANAYRAVAGKWPEPTGLLYSARSHHPPVL